MKDEYKAGRRAVAFLLVLAAAVLASCTAARAPLPYYEEAVYDWEHGSIVICPQIRHAFRNEYQPRIMKVNAMRIDISDKEIGFAATMGDPDAGKPMPDCPEMEIVTRRATTRSFLEQARKPVQEGGRGLDMVVAVNASPWSPWKAPWNHKYACRLGLIVNEGKLVSEGNGRPAFMVRKDGRAFIAKADKDFDISDIAYAVGGFEQILTAGKVSGNDTVLAPRTGYGISEDGRFMVIVTVDGRQRNYSEGCTVAELGRILRYLGCHDGINMDGGGSTTLLYWDKDSGKAVKCNHQGGGIERSNGSNFGIILRPQGL